MKRNITSEAPSRNGVRGGGGVGGNRRGGRQDAPSANEQCAFPYEKNSTLQ